MSINKSWDNISKSYKTSHKNWLEASKKLEKIDKTMGHVKGNNSSTDFYEVLLKYQSVKREAEINKDIYLVNEANMRKEEDYFSMSIKALQNNIKQKSQEIYQKCLTSLDKVRKSSEDLSVKCQTLPNILVIQEDKLQNTEKRSKIRDSGLMITPLRNANLNMEGKVPSTPEREIRHKSCFIEKVENIEAEEPFKRDSRNFGVKKILNGGVTSRNSSNQKEMGIDSVHQTNEEIKEANCAYLQPIDLSQYLYKDVTEDLVRFYTNAVSSQDDIGRITHRSEQKDLRTVYSTPVVRNMVQTTVKKQNERKGSLSLSVK